jgi:hypothetical protein
LITSVVVTVLYCIVLFILSYKLIVYSLWAFPNVSNLNPVKQWGCLSGGKLHTLWDVPCANLYYLIGNINSSENYCYNHNICWMKWYNWNMEKAGCCIA